MKKIKASSSVIVNFDSESESNKGLIWEAERELIRKSLIYYNGNRKKTAQLLGVSVRTIRNKLNEYEKLGLFE